jgi:hypothetical protein
LSGASHLREGDLRLILGSVEEGHRVDPAEAMPWSVLEGLGKLVRLNVHNRAAAAAIALPGRPT